MFNDKKDCVRTWYLGVALLQLFWFCPNSLADGKVYSSVAYKAPPQIPSQSALIRFKEGVETLAIPLYIRNEAVGGNAVTPHLEVTRDDPQAGGRRGGRRGAGRP